MPELMAVKKQQQATKTEVAPDAAAQAEVRDRRQAVDESADVWEGDFEGMDEVDRASAMSFPASDPPSFSEPD